MPIFDKESSEAFGEVINWQQLSHAFMIILTLHPSFQQQISQINTFQRNLSPGLF